MTTPVLTIGAIVLVGAGIFVGYNLTRDTTAKVHTHEAEVKAQAAEIHHDVDAFLNRGKASASAEERAQQARREADQVAERTAKDRIEREKLFDKFGDAVKSLYDLAGDDERAK